MLKYYNMFDPENSSNQKFIYEEDYKLVESIVDNTGVVLRTLDVQIVDLADEIAYAAHDLEDGLRTGNFTAEDILHDFYRKVKNKKCKEKLEEILNGSREKQALKRKM